MVSQKIHEKVALLPLKPGVYIMKDQNGQVIYVGKAKKLKNRVKTYFDGSQKTVKTYNLVSNIVDFDYILTPSELDAFSLESNLIKKYKPKYNILLKDDKSFPFIKIDLKERFPRVQVVRRPKKDGALLFGPYVTGIRISEIMSLIKWAYPIRWCNTNFDGGKQRSRPCLHGEIGNCLAPCAYPEREEEYDKTIKEVIAFLNGDNRDIKQRLKAKMNEKAKDMLFEDALEIKNLLYAVDKMDSELITSLTNNSSIDVFALYLGQEFNVINVMKIRSGKNVGQFNYPLEEAVGSESELVSSFISSYYEQQVDLPREIILSDALKEDADVIEEYLYEKFSKRVKTIFPVRGLKKQLYESTLNNAREFAENSRDKFERHKRLTTDALNELKEVLNVSSLNRIEGYDISNISGTNNVASMVVFVGGEPSKKEYRKFKIKTVEGANDVACLAEALTRRLTDLMEKKKNFDQKPDLLVIDGGLTQLRSVQEVLEKLGLFIPVISLAKQEEEIFVSSSNQPLRLPRESYALRLLQRVRDESHRFAVYYHRNLRGQSLTSFLNSIEGVGNVLSERIWKKFKTKENIFEARPEDFAQIDGISAQKGIEIYNKIHEN